MSDIIKVVRVDLNKVSYKKSEEQEGINWGMLWDTAKPQIIDEIKAIMQSDNIKFPIVLQSSLKTMVFF
jgi:hypothetical protein